MGYLGGVALATYQIVIRLQIRSRIEKNHNERRHDQTAYHRLTFRLVFSPAERLHCHWISAALLDSLYVDLEVSASK